MRSLLGRRPQRLHPNLSPSVRTLDHPTSAALGAFVLIGAPAAADRRRSRPTNRISRRRQRSRLCRQAFSNTISLIDRQRARTRRHPSRRPRTIEPRPLYKGQVSSGLASRRTARRSQSSRSRRTISFVDTATNKVKHTTTWGAPPGPIPGTAARSGSRSGEDYVSVLDRRLCGKGAHQD